MHVHRALSPRPVSFINQPKITYSGTSIDATDIECISCDPFASQAPLTSVLLANLWVPCGFHASVAPLLQSRRPAKPDTAPLTPLLHGSLASELDLPQSPHLITRYCSTLQYSTVLWRVWLNFIDISLLHPPTLRPRLRVSYFNSVNFYIQSSKSGVII